MLGNGRIQRESPTSTPSKAAGHVQLTLKERMWVNIRSAGSRQTFYVKLGEEILL